MEAVTLLLGLAWGMGPSIAPGYGQPLPELDGAEPAVAAKIRRLHGNVRAQPESAGAWGRYGMTLDAHRYYAEAEQAYRRAIELDDAEVRWPYYLGALLELSRPTEAARWLERSLRLDPGYAAARIRLARILEKLDRRAEAREHYRQATRLAPEDPLGPLGLGRIALHEGRTEEAIDHLEEARRRGPGLQAVVATLARAHHRAGDAELARQLADEARTLPRMLHHHDPLHAAIGDEAVDRESYLRRATTYRETGQLERAREEIVELLALDPDLAAGHLALARVHAAMGEPAKAIAAAREALAIDPESGAAHSLMADSLFELGRLDAAERAAREVLAVSPREVRMHLLLSMTAAARGDVGEVMARLDDAYALGTADPALRQVMTRLIAEMAAALAEVGRFEEAARRMEQVVGLAAEAGAPPEELRAHRRRLQAYRAGQNP